MAALETVRPLRRRLEPRLRRTVRNFATGALSLAVVTLLQAPILMPLGVLQVVSIGPSPTAIWIFHALLVPRCSSGGSEIRGTGPRARMNISLQRSDVKTVSRRPDAADRPTKGKRPGDLTIGQPKSENVTGFVARKRQLVPHIRTRGSPGLRSRADPDGSGERRCIAGERTLPKKRKKACPRERQTSGRGTRRLDTGKHVAGVWVYAVNVAV